MDVGRIRQAIAAGLPALGENRVQEARTKIQTLGHSVPWHLVGTLQTNKAKDAVLLFDLIHSVNRLELARREAYAALALNFRFTQKRPPARVNRVSLLTGRGLDAREWAPGMRWQLDELQPLTATPSVPAWDTS